MWDKFKENSKPLVLYGTGDAAEKIMKELDIRGIRVSGIFASDGFVRDRYFHGFKVLGYEEAKRQFGDMTVLLCFGSHRPEVLENICRIASEQDFCAPDLPVAGEGLFDRKYYKEHLSELSAVREKLADEKSRQVLDSVIEYKLTGRIEPLLACQTPEEENWKLCDKGTVLCHAPAFLDLGAYTGDTVEQFLKVFGGRYSKITAVEPESRNFRKLKEDSLRLFGPGSGEYGLPENIRLVNAAAGDADCTVEFTHGTGRGGAKGKGRTRPVQQLTVDSMLGGGPVDIIKMDLEGAEAAAIRGAEQTIRSFRPRMLIAAYHRTEDLFAIPEQVLKLNSDYSVYLRKDPCLPAWGVNYFFI
ncbi:MAG: FkbM family methyltransferase [Firmicutes bacterium]|nr:FkbM family methyltransferase [Bacillota bacterium]